jgi:hypothetical protein
MNEEMIDKLPCDLCGCGYGKYRAEWCPILGRTIKTVNDIPFYYTRIPELGKTTNRCMGFVEKVITDV